MSPLSVAVRPCGRIRTKPAERVGHGTRAHRRVGGCGRLRGLGWGERAARAAISAVPGRPRGWSCSPGRLLGSCSGFCGGAVPVWMHLRRPASPIAPSIRPGGGNSASRFSAPRCGQAGGCRPSAGHHAIGSPIVGTGYCKPGLSMQEKPGTSAAGPDADDPTDDSRCFSILVIGPVGVVTAAHTIRALQKERVWERSSGAGGGAMAGEQAPGQIGDLEVHLL